MFDRRQAAAEFTSAASSVEGVLGEVIVRAVGFHPGNHASLFQVPSHMEPAAECVNTVIATGPPWVGVENWQVLTVDALERVLDDAFGGNEF